MPKLFTQGPKVCYSEFAVDNVMCHRKWIFVALGWALLVSVWPRASNVATQIGQERVSDFSVKEGLYKSRLTKTSFGMLGFQLFESKEGRRQWNIDSRFAEFDRQKDFVAMEEVNAAFFAATTGNVIKTVSRYGGSWINKEEVHLREDVKIRSRRGYLFEMDTLDYQGNKHEFYTKDAVKMRGPDIDKPRMFLKGLGLNALIDRELFVLHQNVSARRQLASSEWLEIKSNRGEFFSEDQKAVFYGQVKSVLPEMEITSRRFEIVMEGDNSGESLLAEGAVNVITAGKNGTADKAFIEVGKDVVVLEGNANVQAKGNQFSGSRIEMYTNEDRIIVIQASGRGNLASEN